MTDEMAKQLIAECSNTRQIIWDAIRQLSKKEVSILKVESLAAHAENQSKELNRLNQNQRNHNAMKAEMRKLWEALSDLVHEDETMTRQGLLMILNEHSHTMRELGVL